MLCLNGFLFKTSMVAISLVYKLKSSCKMPHTEKRRKNIYTCIYVYLYLKRSYLIRRVTCYNGSKDTASRKQICKLAEALSQSRNFYTKFLSTINGLNGELKQTRFWLTHVNRKWALHSWAVFLPKFSGNRRNLAIQICSRQGIFKGKRPSSLPADVHCVAQKRLCLSFLIMI